MVFSWLIGVWALLSVEIVFSLLQFEFSVFVFGYFTFQNVMEFEFLICFNLYALMVFASNL